MRFSIFQESALGARPLNQDRMGYCFTRDSLLMVVADGLGGHPRGEAAAQVAVEVVGALFQRLAQPALADPGAFLTHALRAAHREILRYQRRHRMPQAPRTTVVACVVQNDRAWWAHAGDSRLYWIRDGAMLLRTRDHSKVENLVAMGLLAADRQDLHPERNKVLNCLGSPFDPEIELAGPMPLHADDLLLLCSDGLWSALPDAQLCRMAWEAPVMRTIPLLVRHALARAGRFADNVTAVAMRWEGSAGHQEPGAQAADLGGVTTTIAFDPHDPAASEALTEEEIERAILEIRAAIGRGEGR